MIHPYLVQALWSLQTRIREISPGWREVVCEEHRLMSACPATCSELHSYNPDAECLYYAKEIVQTGLLAQVCWSKALARWEDSPDRPSWKCPICKEHVDGPHVAKAFIWLGPYGRNRHGFAPDETPCAGNAIADEFRRLRPDLFPGRPRRLRWRETELLKAQLANKRTRALEGFRRAREDD